MKITTKELRIQPGKIIDHVAKGHEVIITYHGKALAFPQVCFLFQEG